jgi:hypothetical protein
MLPAMPVLHGRFGVLTVVGCLDKKKERSSEEDLSFAG